MISRRSEPVCALGAVDSVSAHSLLVTTDPTEGFGPGVRGDHCLHFQQKPDEGSGSNFGLEWPVGPSLLTNTLKAGLCAKHGTAIALFKRRGSFGASAPETNLGGI